MFLLDCKQKLVILFFLLPIVLHAHIVAHLRRWLGDQLFQAAAAITYWKIGISLQNKKLLFHSCFPEQVPLRILIEKHGLHQGLCPFGEIVFEERLIQKNTQFLIQY